MDPDIGVEKRLRALVIDDDVIHLELARAMLAKRGFAVEVVGSAAAARSRDLNVDVMLLDLNMPDFDGVEFLNVLVERRFSGGLIIVSGAVSAVRDSAASLAKVHGLLLLGLIPKPLTEVALDAVLLPGRSGGVG